MHSLLEFESFKDRLWNVLDNQHNESPVTRGVDHALSPLHRFVNPLSYARRGGEEGALRDLSGHWSVNESRFDCGHTHAVMIEAVSKSLEKSC